MNNHADAFSILSEKISIYDLLDAAKVQHWGEGNAGKISCPFHGEDIHKSAYVYPDSNSIYCFVCSQAWDVVDFWAEYNEWYKERNGEQALDVGKAIVDLKERYDIEIVRPTWQERFYAIKGQLEKSSGFEAYDEAKREDAWRLTGWLVSLEYTKKDREERERISSDVMAVWDEFETLDLTGDDWKGRLDAWRKRAKAL